MSIYKVSTGNASCEPTMHPPTSKFRDLSVFEEDSQNSRFNNRAPFQGNRDSYRDNAGYSSQNSYSSGYGNRNAESGFQSRFRDRAPYAGGEREHGHQDAYNSRFGPIKDTNWEDKSLVTIEKNFYKEHADITAMEPAEVDTIRNAMSIKIQTRNVKVPKPISSFIHAQFPTYIQKVIDSLGFDAPTSIQVQGWPIALSGHDLIGIAETGSGKTLAFLLPAIVHMKAQPPLQRGDGPICLIFAPTRELVVQIKEVCDKFGRSAGVYTGVAYGGVPRGPQIRVLRRGCEILVACPGRLIDFLSSDVCNLHRVTYLVLDEADRMLDMGFEPQIRRIVSQIRPDRQTLMWSATWPREVQSLARDLCREEPIHVVIGTVGLKTCHNIEQHIGVIEEHQKLDHLKQLLEKIFDGERVLIFSETQRATDSLGKELRNLGYPALSLHGKKEQQERTWVLEEFKSKRAPMLIATDVASRGLDVKDIKYVINFDFPKTVEDYVHRIGRTGRGGASGTAYSFFTPSSYKLAKELIEIMKEANQTVPQALLKLRSGGGGYSDYGSGNSYGRGDNDSYRDRYSRDNWRRG